MRMRLKSQINQKDFIEVRIKAPGVRAMNLIPNSAVIGNCRLRNRQGHHSMEGPGRGWNPYPGASPTTELLTVGRPQSKDPCFVWRSFITDHPPGPTKSPFTTCRVRAGIDYNLVLSVWARSICLWKVKLRARKLTTKGQVACAYNGNIVLVCACPKRQQRVKSHSRIMAILCKFAWLIMTSKGQIERAHIYHIV